MKIISLSGLILSILFLGFALYLHFVVAPAAYIAEKEDQSTVDALYSSGVSDNVITEYMMSPERMANFEKMEMKTDYGMYALFGSILPFLLCAVAAIKKQKIAYLGLVFSLTAFFIGAAYGSHMFS